MRSAFAKSIALLVLLALAPPVPAEAEEPSAAPKKETEKGKSQTFDPTIAKRVNRALDEMQAQRYDVARDVLETINFRRAKPYEVSRVEQVYAAIDQSQEKYGSAREHLGRALASGGLDPKEASAIRFQMAKLLLAEERWAEGVASLEEWFALESDPNSAAYYVLAVAQYQIQDLEKAVASAQKAVDLAGSRPDTSWLQLLLALRLKREEYDLAYPVLLGLIERQPQQKNYWVQASSAALSGGDYDNATALLQVARTGDLLTEEKEIRSLAGLLIFRGIPHRAALLLEQAIADKRLTADAESYELLGNCWIAARDYGKAVEPLTRAGELGGTGEPYLRLAEVYSQQEKWPDAVDALRHGIDKGNLKRGGLAELLMGIAYFNQRKIPEARTWFQRAAAHREQKMQAEAWLTHADNALAAGRT